MTYVTWGCALHWPIRDACAPTSTTCWRTNHLPYTEIPLCAMTLNPKCLPEIMCKRGVLGNAPSSGVNFVSAFHKLLYLHVKSSQWFLVPSDINY